MKGNWILKLLLFRLFWFSAHIIVMSNRQRLKTIPDVLRSLSRGCCSLRSDKYTTSFSVMLITFFLVDKELREMASIKA